MNPIYKALAELDSQTEFNANPYYDSIEKLSRISQGMAHTPRLSEARAPNSQEWGDTLSFLKGGYTPQITGDMNGLARLMEYAKQDASQVADFFVGGLANYADQANFNQDHGYLDTGIAALEASPITAGLAKLSHLSSPMVKSLGNTLSDDMLTTPMRNQIGAVGAKSQLGAVGLPMDEASRMARAREMGYDTDTVYYHSTKADIDEFSNSLKGSKTGASSAKEGYFFADSPEGAEHYGKELQNYAIANIDPLLDQEILSKHGHLNPNASDTRNLLGSLLRGLDSVPESLRNAYGPRMLKQMFKVGKYKPDAEALEYFEKMDAIDDIAKMWQTNGATTYPVFLKKGNVKTIDADRESASDIGLASKIRNAKKEGYDSILFKDIYDPDVLMDEAVVRRANQIRSIFAEFDPKKAGSRNILAGSLSGILGANYLLDDID